MSKMNRFATRAQEFFVYSCGSEGGFDLGSLTSDLRPLTSDL